MSNARLDKQKLDGKLTQSKAKLDRSKWTKMDEKNKCPFLNWKSKYDENENRIAIKITIE